MSANQERVVPFYACEHGIPGGCADDPRPATLVAEVKDDISRNRTREFMQVLESRKVEADATELPHLERLLAYLAYTLDPTAPRTSYYELYYDWSEMRRREGDYHDEKEPLS